MLHPRNIEVIGSRALRLWIDAHHGLPLNTAAAATRYRREKMVHHAARFAGFALAIALFAAVVGAGSTSAQEAQGMSVELTPSRGSGVSGTATLEDVEAGQLFGEDKERFILLHAETIEGEGVPPGIACADLAPSAAKGVSLNEETTMMGETTM